MLESVSQRWHPRQGIRFTLLTHLVWEKLAEGTQEIVQLNISVMITGLIN